MPSPRSTPRFEGLAAASPGASAAARGSSKKLDTRCELVLRRALRARGVRYRLHVPAIPGKPDLVFPAERVVVFCDGDFWHGRHPEERLGRLAAGHNAQYWTAKIQNNIARDERTTTWLTLAGWRVIRLWETDILGDPGQAALVVIEALAGSCPPETEASPRRRSRAGRLPRQ